MFNVRLERMRELSATTRDFRFVRTDGETLDYQPGQFFRFVFEDADGEFERSYSLCNFDELYGKHLDLVISRVEGGRATKLLLDGDADLTGLEAKVTGPFGRLVLPKSMPGRLILVATSVGLAPYMPILRQLESLDYPEVVLLLGIRDHSEFIYGDTLTAYASTNANFELRVCLSREPAENANEYAGYVNEQLEALDPDPEKDHVLLCGNPAMIDDAWAYLKSLDFKPRNVVREKYVFARESKPATKAALTEEQKRLIADKMKKYQKDKKE